MKEEIQTLVRYRLNRAHEALAEAEMLLNVGHANTFVNRLYYACFYAVSAVLLSKGLASAKHSGVRALFHQQFVKSGLVDVEMGSLYDRLFDNRQKADYADLVHFELDEIAVWRDEAKEFVAAMERIAVAGTNRSLRVRGKKHRDDI